MFKWLDSRVSRTTQQHVVIAVQAVFCLVMAVWLFPHFVDGLLGIR